MKRPSVDEVRRNLSWRRRRTPPYLTKEGHHWSFAPVYVDKLDSHAKGFISVHEERPLPSPRTSSSSPNSSRQSKFELLAGDWVAAADPASPAFALQSVLGTVIFTDASWKYRNVQAATGTEATGIGVFIKNNSGDNRCSIKLQAMTHISSVLQAEAKPLLLVTTLPQILNIDRPTLVTDNQTLATVAASRKLDHPLLQSDTREVMACFFNATAR